jgi:hypothetical protein
MHKSCKVCHQPMLEGQALNGHAGTHWACKSTEKASDPEPRVVTVKKPLTKRALPRPSKAQEARFQWLVQWATTPGNDDHLNILDNKLVCAYIDAHGAEFFPMRFGAPKCPQLGRDLAFMYKTGLIKTRSAIGLSTGDASLGFPKWVYSYQFMENVDAS